MFETALDGNSLPWGEGTTLRLEELKRMRVTGSLDSAHRSALVFAHVSMGRDDFDRGRISGEQFSQSLLLCAEMTSRKELSEALERQAYSVLRNGADWSGIGDVSPAGRGVASSLRVPFPLRVFMIRDVMDTSDSLVELAARIGSPSVSERLGALDHALSRRGESARRLHAWPDVRRFEGTLTRLALRKSLVATLRIEGATHLLGSRVAGVELPTAGKDYLGQYVERRRLANGHVDGRVTGLSAEALDELRLDDMPLLPGTSGD